MTQSPFGLTVSFDPESLFGYWFQSELAKKGIAVSSDEIVQALGSIFGSKYPVTVDVVDSVRVAKQPDSMSTRRGSALLIQLQLDPLSIQLLRYRLAGTNFLDKLPG